MQISIKVKAIIQTYNGILYSNYRNEVINTCNNTDVYCGMLVNV